MDARAYGSSERERRRAFDDLPDWIAEAWLPRVEAFYLSSAALCARYGMTRQELRRRRKRRAQPLPRPILYAAGRPIWLIHHLDPVGARGSYVRRAYLSVGVAT
jgi:hypothetical protein